jgi:hypothetical protein
VNVNIPAIPTKTISESHLDLLKISLRINKEMKIKIT